MIDSTNTYKLFSEFYDIYTERFKDNLPFYNSICSNHDKIIEIGCGTGRILEPLLQNGNKITGVDNSPEMLEKAKSKLKKWILTNKLKLINHEFSNNTLDGRYDTALITFYTFNYIIEEPAVFLENVYKAMNIGSSITLDLFFPNTIYNKEIDNRWITKEYNIHGKQIKLKDKRSVKNNIELRQQFFSVDKTEIKINTYRKYYSPVEIRKCLNEAGFDDVKYSISYNKSLFEDKIDESLLTTNFVVQARK